MSFFARGQPPYLGCVGQALKAGINLLICQSMCLAVYPSIYNLSVYLSPYLSIQLYFYRNMFIYQSIFISILFIYLSNNLNIHLHFFNQGWTNFGEDNQDLKCIFAESINNESSYWANNTLHKNNKCSEEWLISTQRTNYCNGRAKLPK